MLAYDSENVLIFQGLFNDSNVRFCLTVLEILGYSGNIYLSTSEPTIFIKFIFLVSKIFMLILFYSKFCSSIIFVTNKSGSMHTYDFPFFIYFWF